ncbi:MAG: sulfotransferase [Pseudomonadota bacterium]
MSRRTAIILGAMKAGTTTLHGMLSQHPEICPGRKKELDFFRKDRGPMPEAYLNEFPKFDEERHSVQLDSSPNYTKVPMMSGVPERIADYTGPIRMIYILRDPVERIRSHIYHNFKQGRWSPETLTPKQVDFCISVSTYHMQLEAYARANLEDDIMLVDFHRIVENPETVALEIHQFIGIERIAPKSTRARHVNAEPKSKDEFIDLERCRDALSGEAEILESRYGFRPSIPWS